jgi:hypothetical protein
MMGEAGGISGKMGLGGMTGLPGTPASNGNGIGLRCSVAVNTPMGNEILAAIDIDSKNLRSRYP